MTRGAAVRPSGAIEASSPAVASWNTFPSTDAASSAARARRRAGGRAERRAVPESSAASRRRRRRRPARARARASPRRRADFRSQPRRRVGVLRRRSRRHPRGCRRARRSRSRRAARAAPRWRSASLHPTVAEPRGAPVEPCRGAGSVHRASSPRCGRRDRGTSTRPSGCRRRPARAADAGRVPRRNRVSLGTSRPRCSSARRGRQPRRAAEQ